MPSSRPVGRWCEWIWNTYATRGRWASSGGTRGEGGSSKTSTRAGSAERAVRAGVALARMGRAGEDRGGPRIGGQELTKPVEVELEPLAHQARGGRGRDLTDVGPGELEPHVRAQARRLRSSGTTQSGDRPASM